jgi:antitoxin HicB
MKYPATFEPVEGGKILVTFPDVDEALSQGDNEQDALAMAEDALVTIFAYYIRHGMPVPPPGSSRKGKKHRMIELPAIVSLKIGLYNAFLAADITKAEFARRLGIPKTTVDRLFDFRNQTRIDQIEAAFAVLGKRLSIEVEDAACNPAA